MLAVGNANARKHGEFTVRKAEIYLKGLEEEARHQRVTSRARLTQL